MKDVKLNFHQQADLHRQIYSRDNPEGESHGWIQWKGTDVCIDLRCKCGHLGHMDCDFFYHYECPACGTKYSVGQNVKLIELTAEEIEYVERNHVGFKTETLATSDQAP